MRMVLQHYNSVVLDDNPKFRRLVATRRVFCQHFQAVSVPVVLTVVTEHDQLTMALLHKDLKVKTSHIYSNLSDNSGMWSA